MNAMENTNHFGYFARDVATELEITTSTLRRWSIELEKVGYTIERNEKEQRIYFERDFKALRELKKLLSNTVPFIDAIKAVVAMDLDNQNATWTPSAYKQKLRLSKDELKEIIHHEVKKAIEEEREIMFQAFERKMNDTIEVRDKQLTLAMKNTFEEKQNELAASLESTQKKKWWNKLFSK